MKYLITIKQLGSGVNVSGEIELDEGQPALSEADLARAQLMGGYLVDAAKDWLVMSSEDREAYMKIRAIAATTH